ncbi:MAG: hypothetical protein IJO46_10720, partial [Thermoguttaceae bacterium]|nr:hypothetical protein [Thermoguttaceae bacterium]
AEAAAPAEEAATAEAAAPAEEAATAEAAAPAEEAATAEAAAPAEEAPAPKTDWKKLLYIPTVFCLFWTIVFAVLGKEPKSAEEAAASEAA